MEYIWSPNPAYLTNESLTKGIAMRNIHVGGDGRCFYYESMEAYPTVVDRKHIHDSLDSAILCSIANRNAEIFKLETRIKELKAMVFHQVRNCVR